MGVAKAKRVFKEDIDIRRRLGSRVPPIDRSPLHHVYRSHRVVIQSQDLSAGGLSPFHILWGQDLCAAPPPRGPYAPRRRYELRELYRDSLKAFILNKTCRAVTKQLCVRILTLRPWSFLAKWRQLSTRGYVWDFSDVVVFFRFLRQGWR